MAQEQTPNFEIPSEMRKLAEQAVEQARKTFDSVIAAAHTAISDMEGRAETARTGARDVGERAMDFAKQNVSASFDFAQRLVGAEDVSKIMELQSQYLKDQIAALNAQAKELSEAATKLAMKTVNRDSSGSS
jgi:phasin